MSPVASQPLMIIDDDDDLREALVDVMSAQGYDVVAFADARVALTALEEGQSPFLILLDLMMPGMSGWEFRAAQQANPKLLSIPVVLVSAANMLSDGVHSFSDIEMLRKPFDLNTLLTTVARYAAPS